MYQKRKQKSNEKKKKLIEKRNKEDDEEEREEEQEEKTTRGLSKKKYVCSCIIENMSLIFTDYLFTIYRWTKDVGWRMQCNLRVKKYEFQTKY